MRLFSLVLLANSILGAAMLPEAIGPYKRTSTAAPALADRPIWDEYGLKESETAAYESGKKKLTATLWRLQDSTGAFGAFEWQRHPQAKPSAIAKLASESPTGLLVAHGNYLLSLEGYKPTLEELAAVLGGLANVDATSLPVLPGYLPAEGLVPNSERYVIGPAALEKFMNGIPASAAAFRFGTEAQLGTFRSPKGQAILGIFSYPTHQIAMERISEFDKTSGAVTRRSGPLVSVVLSPADPDLAEHLLSQVRYQAEITRDEYVPTRRDNIGHLVITAFVLIGILLAFSVVAGFAFGGVRVFLRRGRKGEEADPLITLNLRRS